MNKDFTNIYLEISFRLFIIEISNFWRNNLDSHKIFWTTVGSSVEFLLGCKIGSTKYKELYMLKLLGYNAESPLKDAESPLSWERLCTRGRLFLLMTLNKSSHCWHMIDMVLKISTLLTLRNYYMLKGILQYNFSLLQQL